MRLPLAMAILFSTTGPSALPALQTVWPGNEWARSAPEAQGMDPAPLAALDARVTSGDFGYVDQIVIIRNGRMVMNERYPQDYAAISRGLKTDIGCGSGCDDPAWDHQFNYLHPDWHPYHQGQPVHTLQSVTKSVSATLIGVAIGRGEIAGVHTPLLPLLDRYDVSGVDPRLHRATLEDLLTMRTGIEWHETDRPLNNTNTTIQLERADDWVSFTLAQPMDAAPGDKWVYNSGGSQLMAAIIRRASGLNMDVYAERYLFGPLGIDEYHWKKTPAGLPDALGGLYLTAEDLARVGYLYLQRGQWNGRQILSPDWVTAATANHVRPPGYGYQWWRPDQNGVEVWAGQGFGGQFLLVLPAFDVVAVVNSWNVFGLRVPSIRYEVIDAVVRSVRGAH